MLLTANKIEQLPCREEEVLVNKLILILCLVGQDNFRHILCGISPKIYVCSIFQGDGIPCGYVG